MQVTTISRDTGNIIHVGEVNDEALHNPKATGYLGYRKHLILRDPALGGIEAAINYLEAYRRKIFIPPRTGRFEMFGRAGIKPLDVIIVDGQLFRIVNITYRLAKQDFNFLMNIEGEWFDSV
jgi:hypothetical protein